MTVREVNGSLLAVLLSCLLAGCGEQPTPGPGTKTPSKTPAHDEVVKPTPVDEPSTPNDYWEAVYIQGSKVGYAHTRITPVTEQGQPALRIEAETVLMVRRDRQVTPQQISTISYETPTGKLLRYSSVIALGNMPTVTEAKVEGGQLAVTMTTGERTVSQSMPWADDVGGPLAERQSLAKFPLKPGEKRTVRGLAIPLLQIATYELEAGEFSTVPLLDGSQELLKVRSTMALPESAPLAGTLWVDHQGVVHKQVTDSSQLEMIRTSKTLAMAEGNPGKFDLVLDSSVKVNRRLDRPHDTKRIKYRATLASGDPAKVFVSDATQEVKSIDPHTAEITVRRAAEKSPPASPNASPSKEDREANNLVQSDDAKVKRMAVAAVPGETEPRKLAAGLEAFVHHSIKRKDFSKAFATAAEVAETLEGDCTEHSVLLAALARARHMPARVAIGLVYVSAEKGFAFHMWNELWVGDHWQPYDATLGRGGIGAAHLKLTTSNLKDASAFNSFLPVAQVMGQLKLEIVEVEE